MFLIVGNAAIKYQVVKTENPDPDEDDFSDADDDHESFCPSFCYYIAILVLLYSILRHIYFLQQSEQSTNAGLYRTTTEPISADSDTFLTMVKPFGSPVTSTPSEMPTSGEPISITYPISFEALSSLYPINQVEDFFQKEIGIRYPLTMTYTNTEKYFDVEWWMQAQNRSNTLVLNAGPDNDKIQNVYDPDIYRPTSLITNYRPLVFKSRTFFLVFDGTICDVAGGAPYDINYYCGYKNAKEVHRCIKALDENGIKRDQNQFWSQIDLNLLVFCDDDETSAHCLERMRSDWTDFDLWMERYTQSENQVQAICKEEALGACVFDQNSEYETSRCMKVKKVFPKIELVTFDLFKGFENGRKTPKFYWVVIVPRSGGFQRVKIPGS